MKGKLTSWRRRATRVEWIYVIGKVCWC